MRGAISVNFSARLALVENDVALFRVRLDADGLHLSAAGICPVAGVDIYVQRPKAEGAVIARGVAKGLDLLAAMLADKAVVVFGESFLLHFDLFKINTLI